MSWRQLDSELAEAIDRVGPSIVAIRGGKHGPASGIACSETHIVTTAHATRREVVPVKTADGTVHEARVVGRARRAGIGLLRIEGGLTPVTWGPSDGLRPGHLVLAVGRPRGHLRAALGLVAQVSGPWRTRWGGRIDRFIAVDATLPPGGSGGSLISSSGAAVGLNTAGLVHGGTTVPSETVQRLVAQLELGRRGRSFLGASFVPAELPPEVAAAEGRSHAMIVVGVQPGGPAAVSDFQLGDVLLSIGGSGLASTRDLLAWLGEHPPGEPVEARVLRAGSELALTLVPTEGED